jgi:hypothetical protein
MNETARNRWGMDAKYLALNLEQDSPPILDENSNLQPRGILDWPSAPFIPNPTTLPNEPLRRSLDELKLSSGTPPNSDPSHQGQPPDIPEAEQQRPPGHRRSSSASSGDHMLPSLKSSGLLDWNRDNGTSTGTDPQRTVPVGLSWLANESQ